jgi:EmrB/QacA subfamily drug resistance transporter
MANVSVANRVVDVPGRRDDMQGGGAAASPVRPARRGLALGVLCLSLLIVTLDNTVLNVALPTLVRDLGATSTDLQWIVDAYVLVFAGLLLVSGSVADRFGRKWTFIAGLVGFAGCSIWAAFSGSVGMLIAARASMGVGGALIMPSTLALITSMYTDPRERQRAFGLWAATTGAGVALGPIIGGLLLAHFSWGSVFLINVPIAALALVLAFPFVPNSRNLQAGRPDVLGALLSISGLGLLLWAIIDAPVHGWSSPTVIGAGIGGVAVLVCFAVWERFASQPMLRLSFFRRREFSVAVLSVSMVMFGLFGALFVLTQFLQFDLGYTALQTGVRLLPAAGSIILVAPFASLLERAFGTKLVVGAGLLLIAGGLWEISGATVATTYVGTLAGMIMLGVGAALVIPSVTASVMGSLPADHTGIGAATNSAFLQLGGALGVAVIGSQFSTRYQGQMVAALAPYHFPAGVESTILGSVGGALEVAGREGGMAGEMLAGWARTAFVSGMDLALMTGALVAAAAALLALLALPGRPQRGAPVRPRVVAPPSPAGGDARIAGDGSVRTDGGSSSPCSKLSAGCAAPPGRTSPGCGTRGRQRRLGRLGRGA